MTIKVGINGYGRIGRNIVRAIHELDRTGEFDVVALNDLGDAATNAHLTRRDTAHGPFPGTVEVDGDDIDNAQATLDQNEMPAVAFSFKGDGKTQFAELTGDLAATVDDPALGRLL